MFGKSSLFGKKSVEVTPLDAVTLEELFDRYKVSNKSYLVPDEVFNLTTDELVTVKYTCYLYQNYRYLFARVFRTIDGKGDDNAYTAPWSLVSATNIHSKEVFEYKGSLRYEKETNKLVGHRMNSKTTLIDFNEVYSSEGGAYTVTDIRLASNAFQTTSTSVSAADALLEEEIKSGIYSSFYKEREQIEDHYGCESNSNYVAQILGVTQRKDNVAYNFTVEAKLGAISLSRLTAVVESESGDTIVTVATTVVHPSTSEPPLSLFYFNSSVQSVAVRGEDAQKLINAGVLQVSDEQQNKAQHEQETYFTIPPGAMPHYVNYNGEPYAVVHGNETWELYDCFLHRAAKDPASYNQTLPQYLGTGQVIKLKTTK